MKMNKISMFLGVLTLAVVGFGASALQANASQFPLLSGSGSLTIGSTGQSVVELQGLLSELGFLNVPIGVPYGYFGPMTQSALASYQSANGIAPSAGYFGPITRQQMATSFNSKGWLALLYSSALTI